MATLSFFPTALTVINAALREIRGIDPEETASATVIANALETLNFLVTSWQALGLQVWCRKTAGPLTLTASQTSYTVGTGGNIVILRPLEIYQAWLQDSAGAKLPLNQLSEQEYFNLGNATTSSTPNSFYYDARYGTGAEANSGATSKGTLYLWPAADAGTVAARTLYFRYTRPFMDFDSSSDVIDMPQEWFNALKWNLAYEMCMGFGVPMSEHDRLSKRAENTLELALGWDAEKTTLMIRPDPKLRLGK